MAAVEMRGAAFVGTETAEIDHPPDTRIGCSLGEGLGRRPLTPRVVRPAAEHVDEEVGDRDAFHGRIQVGRVVEVGLEEFDFRPEDATPAVEVANERANPDAVLPEGRGQASADDAGGAGDQERLGTGVRPGHLVTCPSVEPLG